ncbi:MAG: hypothetical protein U9Q79_11225, partial [Candidatus Hydrogenedentes bacterium]|nr:hypothetical protein [Candidatus Hydrogenedentota bacterium]
MLLVGTSAVAGEFSGMPTDLDSMRSLLEKSSDVPAIPELATTSPETLITTEQGKEVPAWAQSAERDIPQTTQALYDRYREAGERF